MHLADMLLTLSHLLPLSLFLFLSLLFVLHRFLHMQITCLALCHNVTPVLESDGSTTYQAASPDEVALVKLTESVGLRLIHRDIHTMRLLAPYGIEEEYEILHIFPFTSETKRMGIILRKKNSVSHIHQYSTSLAFSPLDRVVSLAMRTMYHCLMLTGFVLSSLLLSIFCFSLGVYVSASI
jgi:phospholipid-translocating ATPase